MPGEDQIGALSKGSDRPGWQIRTRLNAVYHNSEGVAALEFALILPFLVFAFLAMLDIGLLIKEKISVDQLLRAGSQVAMTDPGPDAVYDIIAATARGEYEVISSGQAPSATQLAVAVSRFYACLEAPEQAVLASTLCESDNPTAAFYRATATKPYREIVIPNLTVNAAFQVQIR